MGATCSGGKSAQVQDTINKITLNNEAKEHLKNLSSNKDPLSKEKIQKIVRGNNEEGKDQDIADMDQQISGLSLNGKNQKLWEAIEKNDVKMVEALFDKYNQDNQQLQESDLYDTQGQSMIHKAASLGHVEILMLILERTGAKPDLANQQLATPLHLACKNNRENVAKFLIGCGVDINMQDEHGQTALLICCIHGHYELAQLIVESSIAGHTPEPIEADMKDHRGLTPLNCAAIKGDYKLTRLLLERGGANIEEASPKGCTPLLYAARGGYVEVVRYMLERGASPLKQDNAGGTVLHHAIEKSHQEVLQVLIESGVDVYSAIEIADNAGRTPIFEAIDNNASDIMVQLLTSKRQQGGFGAQVNVLNYNGQTPLFSAVRECNFDLIRLLVEGCGAKVDLGSSEMVKEEEIPGGDFEHPEEYDSIEEKYFMEAFKNAMTPLHVACLLGYDHIMHYLIDHGANPNLQTNMKGYSCLHLAVLANKPEIIIELLTKTEANPTLPDYSGRTLQEMVEIFIPDYLESFNQLLENLQLERIKRAESEQIVVATHYYNPDDDRQIQGVKNQDQMKELYQRECDEESPEKDGSSIPGGNSEFIDQNELDPSAQEANEKNPQKKFNEMADLEIEIEEGRPFEKDIESVFGRKIALGLIALNWKMKEVSMKIIYKQTEKFINKDHDQAINMTDFVKACTIAIDLTCKEKVIKVFTLSLQLLNLIITSAKIEQNQEVIETFKNVFIQRNITSKLLQKSEESNTRMTNKIHESLLDFSFHPKLGEAHCSSFILQRIHAHNKAYLAKKDQTEQQQIQAAPTSEKEQTLGSFKGLLAQLALLYKFVNSFSESVKMRKGPLKAKDVLNVIIPSLGHQNQDVRNASTKILLDIHRLTGCVNESYLQDLNDKTRQNILEKLSQVVVESQQQSNQKKNKNEDDEEDQDEENSSKLYQYSVDESSEQIPSIMPSQKTKENILNEAKEQILNKGQSKDWTEREIALKHMKESFETGSKKVLLEEEFLTNCTILLKNCLEENNISLYLFAIEVAELFFQKALNTEVVLGSISSLIRAMVLKTTDTNTRVRKKSVDLINQVWNCQLTLTGGNNNQSASKNEENKSEGQSKRDQLSIIIADVICDQQLQEKAIIGRIGLFVKKAQSVESQDDLNKRPHQIILGKNYEQLIEFACQWCSHKNTKVRQNALKLIIEICRLNSIDPRGQPFKQRIINYILGLRPSLRDPLVKKINEVCLASGGGQSEIEGDPKQFYIDVTELELNLATKTRSASMDINKKRLNKQNSSGLPEIVGNASGLPSVNPSQKSMQPIIVLPHSEPLTEEEKQKAAHLIDLFNLDIMTCFFSQTWSTRQASIEKVGEQLFNLDPNRRDAMSAEINKKNLPVQDVFPVFLEFIQEGAKDPVLKNYIAILELFQRGLPIFFRYVQPAQIKKDLFPLVSQILRKTADLKSKIRESSINFCLYLSHQSPIGPEAMVLQVLQELEQSGTTSTQQQTSGSNVAANLGNSHMIASCLNLLFQYQSQTKLLEKQKTNQDIFKRFLALINTNLKHQNPQVRKEAESLFKLLYAEFGDKLDTLLINQKPQVLQKLLQEAKQETGQVNQQQQQEFNVQKAQTQIRTELINQAALASILKGSQDQLQQLKLPNPKKRLKAIVEIKKAIQKELVNINAKTAKDLFEPLTLLMRQLLQDDNPEIYLESLNVLKFIVGSLAPYLSALDLHLMMGQFIGIIVNNTISTNMRISMASDKVIIFFAKHGNIGPFVVAKDILKNLEKIIKAVQMVTKKDDQQQVIQDKKLVLLRFLSILQLLLQHFSIVLCYQVDFYDKCIELVADIMIIACEDQTIKNICVQIIVSLAQIDIKLLEQSVQKQDMNRKTPLRKTMIELEHQQRQGKNVITQDHHAFVSNINPGAPGESPSQNMKDTRGSFGVSSSRTSLFSPGSTVRGNSPGPGLGSSQYEWSKKSIDAINIQVQQNQVLPERRLGRRMISMENDSRQSLVGGSQSTLNQYPMVGQSMQSNQFYEEKKRQDGGLILPDINAMQSTNYNKGFGPSSQSPLSIINSQSNKAMSMTSTGGAGFNSSSTGGGVSAYGGGMISASNRNNLKTINASGGNSSNPSNSIIDTAGGGVAPIGNRPPLYIPTKRGGDVGTKGSSTIGGGTADSFNKSPISGINSGVQQNQQISSFDQFKTDFNSKINSTNNQQPISQVQNKFSSLYQGSTGVGSSSMGQSTYNNNNNSSNIGGGGGGELKPLVQKKSSITNTNSIFKQQLPTDVKFESGVKRYQEKTVTKGPLDDYD